MEPPHPSEIVVPRTPSPQKAVIGSLPSTASTTLEYSPVRSISTAATLTSRSPESLPSIPEVPPKRKTMSSKPVTPSKSLPPKTKRNRNRTSSDDIPRLVETSRTKNASQNSSPPPNPNQATNVNTNMNAMGNGMHVQIPAPLPPGPYHHRTHSWNGAVPMMMMPPPPHHRRSHSSENVPLLPTHRRSNSFGSTGNPANTTPNGSPRKQFSPRDEVLKVWRQATADSPNSTSRKTVPPSPRRGEAVLHDSIRNSTEEPHFPGKGVAQPKTCRNLLFLFGYMGCLVYGVSLWNRYGVALPWMGVLVASGTALLGTGVLLTCLATETFLMHALTTSLAAVFCVSTLGWQLWSYAPLVGCLVLLLLLGYTLQVWDRLEFWTHLLQASTKALHKLPVVVPLTAVLASLSSLVVTVGVASTAWGLPESQWRVWILTGLLLVYFWTLQMLSYATQVVVACRMGAWWRERPATLTLLYHWGCLALGSVLVPLASLLHQLSALARPPGVLVSRSCMFVTVQALQTALCRAIDALERRFNPWGLVYIGLYGYGMAEASEQAKELLHTQGWTLLVSDDIVYNALTFCSILLGAVTSLFTYVVGWFLDPHAKALWALGGFVTGLVVSTMALSLLRGALRTLLVCWAAHAHELKQTDLQRDLQNAWRRLPAPPQPSIV